MEEALRALLLANSGVTNLVSTRVNIGRRPQDVSDMPAIVFQKVSAPRDYHFTGATSLIESRFQCNCYGLTYGSAKLTARAVMAALNAYSGTQLGVAIQRISIDSERDSNETESGADRHLFNTSIDLLIWHDE